MAENERKNENMKMSILCLLIAAALRLAFEAATAQSFIDERDLVAARLALSKAAEGTKAAGYASLPVVHRYRHNAALPFNVIEIYEDEDTIDFFAEEPEKRPSNVPPDFVLVGVVQSGEFVGWIYMSAADVNELHGIVKEF